MLEICNVIFFSFRSKEREIYYQNRNKILYNDYNESLMIKCYSCRQPNHYAIDCSHEKSKKTKTLLNYKNMKTNQRMHYSRKPHPPFFALQDMKEVYTISEEILRKNLADEREGVSEGEESRGDPGNSKVLSSGYFSSKGGYKKYRGFHSMNLESVGAQQKNTPSNVVAIDKLQLYSEFYKDYNIEEIVKFYKAK